MTYIYMPFQIKRGMTLI